MLHLAYVLASPGAPMLPQLPDSSALTGTVKISPLGALQIAVTTHKLRNQMYEEVKKYIYCRNFRIASLNREMF